jgi:hypothetical protein
VMIFDADDSFKGDFKVPKLEIDRYSCKFGYGLDFCWYRPVFLNNRIKWKYFGVLHEYVDCIEPNYTAKSFNIDGSYYIEARTIGGDRNKDEKKYYKDAILLEKALETEKDPGLKARYAFYCAQSFRDYLDFPNAIKYYKLRTTLGCFDEEIHVSYYNAGKLMIAENKYSTEEIEKWLVEGWNYMKDRSECLFELAKYFRLKGDFVKGYLYASLGAKIPFPKYRVLFLHKDIYSWRLKDEMAISAYYLGKHNEAIKLNQKILRRVYDSRVLENLKFSLKDILNKVLVVCPRQMSFSKNRIFGLTMVLHFKDSVDFVKITMNSMFHHIRDIFCIERFILVIDATKTKEIEELKTMYNFFEIVTWKHPSHIISNIKQKLGRHDRFIFHLDDSWIPIVNKNYFSKAMSVLNVSKTYGQLIYNRAEAQNIEEYQVQFGGTLIPDPENTEDDEIKYFLNEKFKNLSSCPVLIKREFFDNIVSLDKPVDDSSFVSIVQNQIDFVRIRKQPISKEN